MAKWVEDERKQDAHNKEAANDDSETARDALNTAMYGQRRSKWLPRTLELLFGGRKETSIEKQMERVRRERAYTEEGRLMELLVDEAEGEAIPDDGELEGSGDDFDG